MELQTNKESVISNSKENYPKSNKDNKDKFKTKMNTTFGEGLKYATGLDQLPAQIENMMYKRGSTFNLMVVGESGLGKTTFINTLFGTSILPNVWHKVEEIKPRVEFNKTTSIVRHKVQLVEDGFNLDFSIIDTPGFGDLSNNSFSFLPITNYIDEQLRNYMFQEEQPNRINLVDNRVHCCLYFINPKSKGLLPLDIEALKHISSRVNLIPILSKADSLTSKELIKIKELIKEIILVQEIKICEFIKDDDVKSNIVKNIPFSVINSEGVVVNDLTGQSIRGRKYKWGIAEVENDSHCDFNKLKRVLMSQNMVDLISSTELYYEKCRTKLIETRINYAKDHVDEVDNNKLMKFNFDDPDSNGINTQLLLTKFNKPIVDELVIEWSPMFLQKQQLQKRKFNEIILMEEKKFKDWKKALFAKQASFNDEIEKQHLLIKILNSSIDELERPKSKTKLNVASPEAKKEAHIQVDVDIGIEKGAEKTGKCIAQATESVVEPIPESIKKMKEIETTFSKLDDNEKSKGEMETEKEKEKSKQIN